MLKTALASAFIKLKNYSRSRSLIDLRLCLLHGGRARPRRLYLRRLRR